MHTPVITAEQLSRGKRKPLAWKAFWIVLGIAISAAAFVAVQFAAADKRCADQARMLFKLQYEAARDPRDTKLRQDAMRARINAETACRATGG
jgi:hypothetical protein